jgi:hypothetical protein
VAQIALFAGGAPTALADVLWLFDQFFIILGLVMQIAFFYQFAQGFLYGHQNICLS